MLSIFDSQTHSLLKKMMDLSTQRHDLIANNIANVNTPGFKRSELSFEQQLISALDSSDSAQIDDITADVVKPNVTPVRHDGNNVDLNIELAQMAENTILYKLYAQFMKKRFDSLVNAMHLPG
ncbi:MAG: flagellar basal body rod protein FlgB [Candidatus Auribacterota bacterium]